MAILLSASLGDALSGIQHKPWGQTHSSLLEAGKQRQVALTFYPLSLLELLSKSSAIQREESSTDELRCY